MSSAVSHDISKPQLDFQAPASRKPRVVFLDVIRGLAALCVLLQHTTEESTSFSISHRPYLFWSFQWFNLGRAGVAAFFLVSGFVIPYSLERANSLKTFWISRFFRLFPLYWFSILVVVAFHFAGNDEMMKGYIDAWKRVLLLNITMLQGLIPPPLSRRLGMGDHNLHAIGLYWTLTLELLFYVIFSCLFALKINKRTLLFGWLSLGVMLAAAAANVVLHRKMPVGQIGLLSFAFLGTAAFRYYSGLISREQLSLLALGAVVVFAVAFGLGFRSPLAPTPDALEAWSSVSMFTSYLGGAALFAGVFLFRGNEFPFPLRWLGMISYSFYLLHYPCWLALMWIPHHGPASAPLWQLSVLTLTCLVSSASYLLVEKPAIELGKRLLGKPKPPTELGRPTMTSTPVGRVSVVTGG